MEREGAAYMAEMGQANARCHIVLVPGFVGFDAFGQLAYYAGVTQAFAAWRAAGGAGARPVALHYFDNFPTASVEMRAERLRKFVAKKILRGEIGGDDELVLVGHSTGGLDIRRMLADLTRGEPSYVDSSLRVEAQQVLARCRRLVFLSVPHFGTTLADFWCSFAPTIQAAVKTGGLGVQLNRDAIAQLRGRLAGVLADTQSDLLWAIEDALNESDERASDASQRAAEREARSELALWLEHMGKDFQIIADLRARPADPGRSKSPAHFDAAARRTELKSWRALGIHTRSYASTVSAKVLRDGLVEGIVGAVRHTSRPVNALFEALNWLSGQWALQPVALGSVLARGALSSVSVPPALLAIHRRPALLFEVFHAMCSDQQLAFPRPLGLAPSVQPLGGGPSLLTSTLDVLANDGVVNTLSMLWPHDPEAAPDQHSFRLVEADHGDIIGHYARRLTQDASSNGRRHEAYDFFPSGSGFDAARFRAVWQDVFDFASS
jgi:hypothetical protein